MKITKRLAILSVFILVLPQFAQAMKKKRAKAARERIKRAHLLRERGLMSLEQLQERVGKIVTSRPPTFKYELRLDKNGKKVGQAQKFKQLEEDFDVLVEASVDEVLSKLALFEKEAVKVVTMEEYIPMVQEGLDSAESLKKIIMFNAKLTGEQKKDLRYLLLWGVSGIVVAKQLYLGIVVERFATNFLGLQGLLEEFVKTKGASTGLAKLVEKIFDINNEIVKTAYYTEALKKVFISDEEFNMAKEFFKGQEEEDEEKEIWRKIENKVFNIAKYVIKVSNDIKAVILKARNEGLIKEDTYSEIIGIIDSRVKTFVEGYNKNVRMVSFEEKLKV